MWPVPPIDREVEEALRSGEEVGHNKLALLNIKHIDTQRARGRLDRTNVRTV